MLHHYHNTSCGGTTMTTTNSTTSTSCGATPPSLPPLEAILLIRYGISIQEARSIVAQGGANLKKLHNQKVVNSNDTSLNKEWTNNNDLKDECIRILKVTRNNNLNRVQQEQHDDDDEEEEEGAIQCVPGVQQYFHQGDDRRRNSSNNYTLKRSPSMISQDAIASDLRSITESIQSTFTSNINPEGSSSQSFCCGASSSSTDCASSPDQQQDELERRIWEAVAHYAEEVDGDNNNADVSAAGANKTKTKPVKCKKDWQLTPKSHRKKKYHHDNNDDDDTKATADDNSTLCFDNGIPRVIYIYYGRPTRQHTTTKVTGTAAASTLQQRRPSFFRRILMMAFGKNNKRNRIQENDPECYEQTLVCL